MEINDFYLRFNEKPEYLYQAPSRINLIGEHIDYNGGDVLPCAIGLYTKAYVRKRSDQSVRLYSENTKLEVACDINNLKYDKSLGWANYPLGLFYILKSKGYSINYGLDIYFSSNIPLGSGLSSSASILDLTCYIINDIYNLGLDMVSIAKISQESEIKYNGLSVGIMDEAAIALGKKDSCLLLDTHNIEYKYIKMDLGKYKFVVLNTCKPRVLTESKYNERVYECNKALEILKPVFNIDNLCQLKITDLDKALSLIEDNNIKKRVRHVVTEEERVKSFIDALDKKDINRLGELLKESHKSLKEDYEVTGDNLDTIVDFANKVAIGARMTGAGFSGCAIALVDINRFDELKEVVLKGYKNKFGYDAEVIAIDIVDGPNGYKL